MWRLKLFVLLAQSTQKRRIRCPQAKRLWCQLLPGVQISDLPHNLVHDRLLALSEEIKDDMLEWICVGAWSIWNDWNGVIHKKLVPDLGVRCEWIHCYIQVPKSKWEIPKGHGLGYSCQLWKSWQIRQGHSCGCSVERSKELF